MLIIGCDFHPGFQQLAIFDNQTGEIRLPASGKPGGGAGVLRVAAGAGAGGDGSLRVHAVVGAAGGGLGHELWLGDAARIRASVVRQQKTDQRDAEHILHLLLEKRFPKLWVPSAEERDVRQLLVHRHQRVRARTQVKNQLQALALNQGLQKKRQLWTEARPAMAGEAGAAALRGAAAGRAAEGAG